MADSVSTPALTDLYRLGAQIQSDADLSVAELQQRDHAIGQACTASDTSGRLMYWLREVSSDDREMQTPWLSEHSAAVLMRAAAAVAGFFTMLGFLLASDRGLVNVFLFLLLFVLLQLLFSAGSAFVMLRSVRGHPPAAFPLNPARFVTSRAMPDKRYLRESSGVVRLLLLRYGQEFGAIFTLGAMTAFLCLLAFTDFSFVWGSTFGISDAAVNSMIGFLSGPWSSWLPLAVPGQEIISDTRYHPSQMDLGQMNDDSRRGWWPFLMACMLLYALLPRLLLWFASRVAYRREIKRSFEGFPGAELVLSRMCRPQVKTQAAEAESADPVGPAVAIDEGVMLLNWAGALDAGHDRRFENLLSVPVNNLLAAGLGSPANDAASVAAINSYKPESLLVAVKAWEPPMADLADMLSGITGVPRCTLCLVPLPERGVAEHSLEEWQAFSRDLSFPVMSAQPLQWM